MRCTLRPRFLALATLAALLAAPSAWPQESPPPPSGQASRDPAAGTGTGLRRRIRAMATASSEVAQEQADELTLTLVRAEQRPLYVWVRAAGAPDEAGRMLTACVRDPNAHLVAPGQRVRAFSPDTKSSMFQARVTSVAPGDGCVMVEAEIAGPLYRRAPRYVMEIVVDRGSMLTIPNEAIIEEGDRQIVYWQMHPGHYVPKEIRTGLHGELYAEVVEGLAEGDEVVTIGSFFIDADVKLRSTEGGGGHAHQHN